MDVEMTSVALNVFDRLTLPSVIPLGVPPGFDLVTGKIVMDLSSDIGFTEAEVAERNIRTEGEGSIRWEPGDPKAVEFGPIALGILRTGLKAAARQWDAGKALNMNHMALLMKFGVGVDALIAELQAEEEARAEAAAKAEEGPDAGDIVDVDPAVLAEAA